MRRWVRKLTKDSTLRVIAVVDLEKVGPPLAAVLAFSVPHGKMEAVSDHFTSLPEVKRVSSTTGSFSLMAMVRITSTDGLSNCIQRELTKLDGVTEVNTASLLLSAFSNQPGVKRCTNFYRDVVLLI